MVIEYVPVVKYKKQIMAFKSNITQITLQLHDWLFL